ncbi:hypothetical protein [Allomuricauda sp. d1]|uniref:hypothetical protein n=1 Tax=Allomuricauda sp. d1 TaxID=3136725 RepID=UPI0031DAA423
MFKLSTPKIEADSLLFIKRATIIAKSGESGSTVYFKRDGQQHTYQSPIVLKESEWVSFWSEHPDFESSDLQTIEVVKITHSMVDSELIIEPQPNEAYNGKGWKTLVDLEKGTTNFRNGHSWLGFQKETITISVKLKKPTMISKLQMGILIDHGSWIFSPKAVKVEASKEIIGTKEFEAPSTAESSESTFLTIDTIPRVYGELVVTIKALDAIPDWHPGKGTVPWIFIDELLIEP